VRQGGELRLQGRANLGFGTLRNLERDFLLRSHGTALICVRSALITVRVIHRILIRAVLTRLVGELIGLLPIVLLSGALVAADELLL
jgi:hypothetical protein